MPINRNKRFRRQPSTRIKPMKNTLRKIGVTLIEGWGKRQAIKYLTIFAGVVGASSDAVPAVAAWLAVIAVAVLDTLLGFKNKKRLEAAAGDPPRALPVDG